MEVLDPGNPSRITDYRLDGYALVSEAIMCIVHHAERKGRPFSFRGINPC